MSNERVNTNAERNEKDEKEQDKQQQAVPQFSSTDDTAL